MSEDGRTGSPKREESESEEDGAVVSKGKRKHFRVVSDGESSDSSVQEARRTRTLPQLQDYSDDSESDWESDNSEDAEPDASQTKLTGCASDSSEGNSDKCPICLLRFSDQSVGIPETCEHMFCVDCITEWSKNVNTCPVDRMTFSSIVVRACAGGRVLHTRPVQPPKNTPFEDIFENDVTRCQVCDSPDNEGQMLLCDQCDQGFHMQCLSPPLFEIPEEEWFCPGCERNRIDLDSSNAFVERLQLHLGRPENSRRRAAATGGGGSTSRARRNITGRRRTTKRRTRTVVHEYDIQNGSKFPIKKRITLKKKAKKRKTKKRAPRTAARRSLVRASVRERLAALRSQMLRPSGTGEHVQELAVTRHRAGIPSLSLFGDRHELDYLSEDEQDDSGGGSTYAVALRPTASVLSAYRQARRKMISIPSPPHASSVPDLLSNIMESQTLLHSKKSFLSIAVDGTVNIKVQTPSSNKKNPDKATPIKENPIRENSPKKDDKVDLSTGEDSSRKAPSYPGHSRGGGWNSEYRGGYQSRDQGNNNNWNNNSNYGRNSYGGDYRGNSSFNQEGNQGNSYQQNSESWNRDTGQGYQEQRSHYQYEDEDQIYNNRQNMQRPQNNQNQNIGGRPDFTRSTSDQGRPSRTPWQQLRPDPPMRHSFGGFDQDTDALDMRMGQDMNEAGSQPDLYGDIENPREPTPPQHYEPLPEPPIFRFMPLDTDKSEDEKSDSGLVIDTEKYDPTEPTHDESSGEQEDIPGQHNLNTSFPSEIPTAVTFGPQMSFEQNTSFSSEMPTAVTFGPQMSFEQISPRPMESRTVESSPLKVPSGLLDKAVAQVLNEHRNLIGSSPINRSIVDDYESDGDCPNFSIYSATSVNIANSSETILASSSKLPENEYLEKEEDLVQEDDDIVTPEEEPTQFEISESQIESEEAETPKEKAAREEYEERLSRKCPITPNKRNPIKIKLNNTTPLIKRHVLDLYADEDEEEDEDQTTNNALGAPSKTDELENRVDPPEDKEEDNSLKTLPTETEPSNLKECEIHEVLESECANLKIESPKEKEEIKSKTSSDNEDDAKEGSFTSDKQTENQSDPADDATDEELPINKTDDEKRDGTPDNEQQSDALEKMTESISESEDERSYTPCLDENKSKEDTSFENEKENLGIEGLDTEMISEEEGNEMFSDDEDQPPGKESEQEGSPIRVRRESQGEEEGEILEKVEDLEAKESNEEGEKEGRKKKRKKLTSKDKSKSKKKSDVTFKKLSKSGKERNYRDKEDKGKTKGKERKKADDKESKEKREKKKEKRKDMERYDVRTIVSEKRRRVKDAFGRDSSRPRSQSPSLPPSLSPPPLSRRSLSHAHSRSKSKDRYTPSLGRRSIRRSTSRGRKSMTPLRRPISPRMRKSISPRGKSPLSPRIRRSFTPRIRRSLSPRVRRSISPRIRTSVSPRLRRSISPRIRRSISPRQQSILRGRRSLSHRKRKSVSPRVRRKPRRSVSPRKRSASPRHRRSQSRGRKRARSRTPKVRKSKSPRKKARRSRSRLRSLSRNRSRTPKPKKTRRIKARKSRSPKRKSPKGKKRLSRSITPELMLSPEMMRERVPPVWRNDKALYQEWSDTRSINSRLLSPSWTPPRVPLPEPHHLRVYLTNKDKAKRKEKKRRRETEKRREQLRRLPETGPSKEVFTSGNNILVSVSFNKDDLGENQNSGGGELGSKKRKRKDESKRERRLKRRKADRKNIENKKPVAIIDLEKSPFREMTPSPKNVIVLSDSDHNEKDDEPTQRQQVLRSELREAPSIQQEVVEPSVHREPAFINSVGPKTPPEPSVKFSILPKVTTQLRPLNPLHEEDEGDENREDGENQAGEHAKEGTRGPNTPPDPPNTPPSSPDAYDPFEPTKSGSATPEQEPNGPENPDPQEKATITLETAQKTNLSADDVLNQRPITPIEKVMALLQSTRNVSPTNIIHDISTEQPTDIKAGMTNAATTNGGQSPDRASTSTAKSGPPQSHFSVSVAPTMSSAPIYLSAGIPRIGAFNNASPRANSGITVTSNQRIVLPSPTKSSPLKTQATKLFLAKPSPIKSTPIKPMPSKTIISKLPLPNVKPIPGRKKNHRPMEILDLDTDMDSPYSPGSSDFGDLFEPPMDINSKAYSKSGKTDIFDSLFGSKGRKNKSSATKVPVKQIKKKGKTQVGVKIDEDSLKILDDLPSSAVEMQVKSKFLKKLNRQERVVEEVKLVLKPHYNKKHVTKEQYKDVLRRAVPKICHNKTGEINVAKIQALVEAYVRKIRKKNKSMALL